MVKKILCVFVAFSMCILILPFRSYAMTHREYMECYLYLLYELRQGKITSSEYQERANAIIDEYYSTNTVDGVLNNASAKVGSIASGITTKIGTIGETVGESISDVINSAVGSIMDKYTRNETQSTVDKHGYGCMAVFYPYNDNSDIMYKVFGEYGTYTVDEKGLYQIVFYGNGRRDYYYKNEYKESITWDYKSYTWAGYFPQFYGDWRNADGTAIPTDDEFQTVGVLDLDKHPDGTPVTDAELLDLLKNIETALDAEFPDTSNMEGLLKAINARLANIDSDNDVPTLNLINAAIVSLATDSHADNTKLIEILGKMKENLEKGENKTNKDLMKELEGISKTLKYLAGLETADLALDVLDLTEQESEYLGKYASLVTLIIDKFGFALVNTQLSDVQSLLLNNAPPSPLTVEVFNNEYAVLSPEMFEQEGMQEALTLARGFVSVLLLAGWLIIMRKKLVGGI